MKLIEPLQYNDGFNATLGDVINSDVKMESPLRTRSSSLNSKGAAFEPISLPTLSTTSNNLGVKNLMLKDEVSPKYIGVIPNSSPKTDTSFNWKDAGKTAANVLTQTLGDVANASSSLARNEYNNDYSQWESQGKYWFNPNADLEPNVDEYLSSMPSSVDNLRSDTWFDGNSPMLDTFINPASFHSDNKALQYIINPLSLADKKMGEGFAAYVGDKAIKGAVGGLAGGGVGAGVGAIVGAISGIFSWKSAKAEDAKNAAKERAIYEKKLKEWTFNRAKRLSDINTQEEERKRQERMTQNEKDISDKKQKNIDQANNIVNTRRGMIDILSNSGSISAANRQNRLQRWN